MKQYTRISKEPSENRTQLERKQLMNADPDCIGVVFPGEMDDFLSETLGANVVLGDEGIWHVPPDDVSHLIESHLEKTRGDADWAGYEVSFNGKTFELKLRENPVRPPCPVCGSPGNRNGLTWTGDLSVQRYHCPNCGRHFSETTASEPRISLTG